MSSRVPHVNVRSEREGAELMREGVQTAAKPSSYLRRGFPFLALALGFASIGCHEKQSPGATVAYRDSNQLDFNRDVQPILASNCFSCHGPDPEMRKSGLRLDLQESAMKKRPGHPDAIVPGHPDQSELIKRIQSKDPHHLMPQTSLGEAKPMKPQEIAVLTQWIKQGAVYRPHWAFEKPIKPPSPDASANLPNGNAIDTFVLARLKKEGLHSSPEADKSTLIRRATLDLTGLLPTPAEVSAFQKDTSPQAYEHLVDNLLARPTYGEHRARYWLDYARYSDTYGLHYDNTRDIWPWRDYLIRTFNSNKPFDQFAMEQIAGDLLPAKNLDPLIASGYVRLGVSSNEGGTIPEELRTNIARERTEAYGAAFMGITVGCAVCHDHKYDPTTQKDFYALSAFFNNLDERPFNNDRPVWEPMVRIPKPANQEAFNRILARRTELTARLNAARWQPRAQLEPTIERALHASQKVPQPVSDEKLALRLRLDEGGGDSIHNTAPHPQTASFPLGKFKGQWGETTWLWPDFRMETSTRVLLGPTGNFESNQAFSSGGWFMLRAAPNLEVTGPTGALLSKMDTTQHNRGWDLSVEKGTISVSLINQIPRPGTSRDGKPKPAPASSAKMPAERIEVFSYPTPSDLSAKDLANNKPPQQLAEVKRANSPPFKPKDAKPAPLAMLEKDDTPEVGLRVTTTHPLPLAGQWKHIFFTYDGSGKASGVKIYVDGAPSETKVVFDSLGKSTILTAAPMQLGWRYPDAAPAQDTRYQDIRLYQRALTAAEAKRLPVEDYVAELARKPVALLDADQWHAVRDFYFNAIDPSFRELESQLAPLDTQLEKLSQGGDLTQVSWEKPSIAYAHILGRGVYTARLERVEANTPHFLPPLPPGEPRNRLALAKWTVSPENPLTARVTVNRMWSELFGAGLVETTEDFGIMGQRPSNPALLDWLAVEFRESGWNVKHIYKLMVMSAAYRQSARSTPEQLAKDPKNLLLSHGPRFRMDAEMLRDIALQSGGLLVGKIGGPSVKPYQPANVWEQVSYPTSDTVMYIQQHGEALFRRSMYTYWKRMAILPDMDAFDAPMRDAVCTRRQRTDTPLQALVTLNDVQWVEAARALAERVMQQGGKQPDRQPDQRIRLMSQILLAHDPSTHTATILKDSLAQMQKHYSADPKAAKMLVEVGEKKHDSSIPEPELAAWTMVASEMLNLDETLNK